MKQLSWLVVPVAALGSALVVAATLLHYAQAHRQGDPGGYLSIGLGAICVGLLAGVGVFLVASPRWRAISVAFGVALVTSLATCGLLLATLIRAFGS
ncbi:hypothetical protein [Lysobacter niastensis]|uniref:Transmembrane protein n=1 Tax=Lysobacter niastensis TaxID=380629 RepID=A0ABS0B7Q1_9GAMM|nr:hypothetical protein [Lysobacter niastensis]MBF6025045.1 hypothetical protein [Lysobacter niastensis]